MHQAPSEKSPPWAAHVTVAAIVERDGRFLVVEERIDGQLLFNQPAGHLEASESLVEACVREVREETGWTVEPTGIVGWYQYHSNTINVTYIRTAFAARALAGDPHAPLDHGIVAAHWLDLTELEATRERHRSPLVLACVRDYLAGDRYPLSSVRRF
ncbi:MAG: NUDIX hydrolase [Gammaproteobacteria bacterium]|nr:NUDIX hydrolase [Gammaproteobacteria bacterium]